MKEYALYRGEEILSIGTVYEIAKDLGIKVDTVKYYGCNAYKRKIEKRKSKIFRELIELEED